MLGPTTHTMPQSDTLVRRVSRSGASDPRGARPDVSLAPVARNEPSRRAECCAPPTTSSGRPLAGDLKRDRGDEGPLAGVKAANRCHAVEMMYLERAVARVLRHARSGRSEA